MLLTVFSFCCISLNAQIDLDNQSSPYDYVHQPRYTLEAGMQFNEPEYYNHPDFGRLTFSSPAGKNVAEDISKRTLDERYYVDLDDQNFFYIEKSSNPINFYKNGQLVAIDPALHKLSDMLYASGEQPVPTYLDIENQQAKLKIGNDLLGFTNVSLEVLDFNDETTVIAANWSQIQVGNFGALITDIFPGIDLSIIFRQGGFKTEFILKQNPGVKELRFVDNFQLPEKYSLLMEGDLITSHFVQIYNNETNETDVVIDPARTRDASGNRESWLNTYEISNHTLKIVCDSLLLNGSDKVYPLSIDPLFTAVGPVTSVFGVRGSLLTPASCSNNLVVSFPGGSTPWDVSASWVVFTDFCYRTLALFGVFQDCWMSDARVWLTSSCGGVCPVGAPATTWVCAGCNTIGTWNPTMGFASSGSQSLAQCYTPSCSNQNLTFTMFDNRGFCSTYLATYDNCTWANSYCVSLDQWSVTVQGRSVETLGNTVTGNGNTTFNDPDCIGTTLLNPTPLYGVSAYTYNWSTGATSPTITVGVSPAVYTCTVTDACGTSVVATFNIGCPLPVRLNSFSAILQNDIALINWETLSESGIEKFRLEKADITGNFSPIALIDPSGNSNGSIYELKDPEPFDGINYYRLALIFEGGEIEYSEVASVHQKSDVVQIDPNPNNGVFIVSINTPTEDEILIEVFNSTGIKVYSEIINSAGTVTKQTLDLSDQSQGVYTINILCAGKSSTEKLIIR